MRVLCFAAACAATMAGSGVAMAASQGYPGDMYMPGSAGFVPGGGDQPLIQSYPASSMCARGLQPVILGGQIWCGTPTGGSYHDPSAAPRVSRSAPLPRVYAPAGE
ncbi:hypothetical protein [Salipiger mangrovisoli]|uniref:Uncharacterized protein n=1 Tax=Salipiger mangrovisoli TaxID=2865933 RepID=A0ABR9X7I5_9RHOB|nr:hypothetical protein [Salipiger mangrovisoli]MBE9639386.1 hypothetical protein [Salipiger mangrovisoli]